MRAVSTSELFASYLGFLDDCARFGTDLPEAMQAARNREKEAYFERLDWIFNGP